MTAHTHALRQQLAQISDIQAALDALRTDIALCLKEAQKCTDEIDTEADTEEVGINRFSGLPLAS